MTWAKLDDNLYDHPKFCDLELAAIGLWALALTWSSRHLTGGRLPASLPARLAPTERRMANLVNQLESARLWDKNDDGGWDIHDFHDYQPTATEVMKSRSDLSEKRAAAGRKGAARRWQTDELPNSKAIATPRQTDGNGHDKPHGKDMTPSRPVPTKELKSSEYIQQVAPQAVDDDESKSIDDRVSETTRILGTRDHDRALGDGVAIGNREFHRDACIRKRRRPSTIDAIRALLITHPNATATDLANLLDQPVAKPSPLDSIAAAQRTNLERNTRRANGQGCPDCDGAGMILTDDGSSANPCPTCNQEAAVL